MKIGLECYGCLVRGVEKALRLIEADEEMKKEIMRRAMGIISESPLDGSTPKISREIQRVLREISGNSDPYRNAKDASNRSALGLVPEIREITDRAGDPLRTALAIAISGNIIDYGAPADLSLESVRKSINDALDFGIEDHTYALFRQDIDRAETILYVGDNTGEIVFDRECIRQLPGEKVTFAVRGGPVLNDATMEDARTLGIMEEVTVVDTGDDTPGIDLTRSSADFLTALKKADMVILKGQGNLETVLNEDLSGYVKGPVPLYYLFKVKCDFVADSVNMATGDIAFFRRTAGETTSP